jgi:hypothetical protein
MIYKTEINFDGIAERIERLKDIPQRIEGIELIVLFGRMVTGRRWLRENVDVAFQVAQLDETKRRRIREGTFDALGTKDLDIAFLNDDLAYRLKWHIGWKGQLVYEAKKDLFVDYKILAASMWFDFKPLWERQLRAIRARKKKAKAGRKRAGKELKNRLGLPL